MPKQPKRKLSQSRPGPKPMRPTAEQRHHVELAVSVGLSVDVISAAMETPRRTIYRHFANEIATGRAKRLLANAVRIDKAASEGSVAAMNISTPSCSIMARRRQQLTINGATSMRKRSWHRIPILEG